MRQNQSVANEAPSPSEEVVIEEIAEGINPLDGELDIQIDFE